MEELVESISLLRQYELFIDVFGEDPDNWFHMKAILYETENHDFPIAFNEDFSGFALRGFIVNGKTYTIEQFELGHVLQDNFPTLYRGIQSYVMRQLRADGVEW